MKEMMMTSPPTPEMVEASTSGAKAKLPAATVESPVRNNTQTTFSDMLNEVLTTNTSYARKFIALKQLGLSDEEIKKVLKQYGILKSEKAGDDVFLDSRNAQQPQKKASPKKKK
jgi:hypothetical protein